MSVRLLLQAMIWCVRRDCAGHQAVNCALPNTLKGIFYDFAAARTGMVNVGQKINSPHCRVGEHENGLNETIVMKSRRDVTTIHQFASFERTPVKPVATQFNALVPKKSVVVVHVVTPDQGWQFCSQEGRSQAVVVRRAPATRFYRKPGFDTLV
jgi:hypothetical protein